MLPTMFTNNWFPTVFDDLFNADAMPAHRTSPAVNVKVDENAYTMEVAAPGLKKDFCRVTINDEGNLCVAIENKFEHKEEDKEEDKKEHYLRREFSYTNYQQAYSLPKDVDRNAIAAKVEDGVLTITLPKVKKEEVKLSRHIEIA